MSVCCGGNIKDKKPLQIEGSPDLCVDPGRALICCLYDEAQLFSHKEQLRFISIVRVRHAVRMLGLLMVCAYKVKQFYLCFVYSLIGDFNVNLLTFLMNEIAIFPGTGLD